ncbi:Rv2018 family toxin-antitoxin system antitoxin [Mycolicibacterium frederiksbergense]|uniref:Rv2018 family toxin-antitoxin system antitoxin n=1 Tax=Mycolicibacterium frederiksbergense TaxID=117567 RepID=UPI00265BC165|nr:DUF433 domain-containing protein [Mycolicibacterium frederiksbergense]MBX9919279.1 DUF433 domain-containing protein [Mycolicibacterium frederiksbergense]MDO0975997.1 DUF433 domain-containing protein [Mycolicibacterium frederiksbergense]
MESREAVKEVNSIVDDLRFDVPLYTLTDASHHLVVPRSTLETWAFGYERRPKEKAVVKGQSIITAVPQTLRRGPQLPFVGVAEAYVLNAFRRAGVPMQRIRPSVSWLLQNVGPHALASKDLYTDGAEVLWDFAQQSGAGSPDELVVKHLIVPRSGQYVFKDIVQHYLKQISFANDKFASSIRLPQYGDANVVLDPYRGYGQPVFDASGVKVIDALGPLRAGETFEAVAADYGVSDGDLRDALDALTA